MQAKEAILSRRSIRKYQTKPIPKEILEDIILAGRSAPTAMNCQEIKQYVIANNIEKVKEIGKKVLQNRAKAGKEGGWIEEYKKNMKLKTLYFMKLLVLLHSLLKRIKMKEKIIGI